MHTALPMNGEDEFSLRAVRVDQDFFDERTHNALLQSHTGGGIDPDRLQLVGELAQALTRYGRLGVGTRAMR